MPVPGQQGSDRTPGPEQQLTKKCRLGINILDVDRINPLIRARLLKGKVSLDKDKIELIPDSPEDRILVFNCRLILAALSIDIIRSENRAEGDEEVRAYLHMNDKWRKLPSHAILALPEDDHYILNPDQFPVIVEAAPIIPRRQEAFIPTRRPKS